MVGFLKAWRKYLGTSILPRPVCLWFILFWPLKSCEPLCLACVPGPLQTEEMEIVIPLYCLAFWSPLITYNNHLASLCSEPDCSSSALYSFYAVLSETTKEITAEIAGDLFSAPVCCEDQLLGGVLEAEMIAWKFCRQLSLVFWSQLFRS